MECQKCGCDLFLAGDECIICSECKTKYIWCYLDEDKEPTWHYVWWEE
jgi:hypothetical protein